MPELVMTINFFFCYIFYLQLVVLDIIGYWLLAILINAIFKLQRVYKYNLKESRHEKLNLSF